MDFADEFYWGAAQLFLATTSIRRKSDSLQQSSLNSEGALGGSYSRGLV